MKKDGVLTWTEHIESKNIPKSAEREPDLQKVVNLLERNGFHVFKAEEAAANIGVARGRPTGVIFLRVISKSAETNI